MTQLVVLLVAAVVILGQLYYARSAAGRELADATLRDVMIRRRRERELAPLDRSW